ncbi:MAG: NUDIX domain-containing protein [Rhizobiaceae bacterium]|nr:NUDIX domain-containing protein [Rhizobiaceae bacterium]
MTASKPETVEDTHLSITIEQQELSYSGFREVRTYAYREDESGYSARREIVSATHAVAVVAFDPKLDKLVMIRQFRIGAQLGTGKGMSAELAAGLIDPGEDPEAAVRRELQEETGLQARHVKPMCRFLTSPGLSDEVLHIFYAEVDAKNLTDIAGHEDENEQTFPFLLTLEQALEAVDSNALHNGIVMIGLMWFARHRDQLVETAT